MSNFKLEFDDMGLRGSIICKNDPLGGSPNQADLREAANRFLFALSNWTDVHVEIESFFEVTE